MLVVHLRVVGRVQGVGFRWHVRESARRLGLSGWVRNCDDGAVELVAEGAASEIEAFLALVREGPAGSQVRNVLHLDAEPAAGLPFPFTVIR